VRRARADVAAPRRAGGTRFIGLYLARQLVAAGHEARARARATRAAARSSRALSPAPHIPPRATALCPDAARAAFARAPQVTLFTRGKTPIAQQIPDDTNESFKAYESKIKHIKGNRQARACARVQRREPCRYCSAGAVLQGSAAARTRTRCALAPPCASLVCARACTRGLARARAQLL
jgi:hypothetical protein